MEKENSEKKTWRDIKKKFEIKSLDDFSRYF